MTVGAVEAEAELRLDADIEMEELLEVTVARYRDEVAAPLSSALELFAQKPVLAMVQERPKLVASVNHYRAKVEDLERSVEEARKLKVRAGLRANTVRAVVGGPLFPAGPLRPLFLAPPPGCPRRAPLLLPSLALAPWLAVDLCAQRGVDFSFTHHCAATPHLTRTRSARAPRAA